MKEMLRCEIRDWRFLPTDESTYATYKRIMGDIADFLYRSKDDEYKFGENSNIRLKGGVYGCPGYTNEGYIRTSRLEKLERDKEDKDILFAHTKSGSIYLIRQSTMDISLVLAMREAISYDFAVGRFPKY